MQREALFSFISPSFIPKSQKVGLYVPCKGGRLPYPALFKGAEVDEVKGELYEILDNDKALKLLDYVEGAPTLYKREVVTVIVDGKEEKAYTYMFNRDPRTLGLKLSQEYKGAQ